MSPMRQKGSGAKCAILPQTHETAPVLLTLPFTEEETEA